MGAVRGWRNFVLVGLRHQDRVRKPSVSALGQFLRIRTSLASSPTTSFCAEMSSWQAEKDRLTKLDATSRRQSYPRDFVSLTDIPPWSKYFDDNKKSLSEKVSEKDHTAFAKAHPDLAKAAESEGLASKVSLFRGDITKLEVDAIVNAANQSLLGGGGVDGAIHRAAGGLLLDECRTLQGCQTGDAKITGAYKLPSKYVIHTVGPRGEKPDLLRSCYDKCLDQLIKNNLSSIAFPCVSTGIYGYPSSSACLVALQAVREFIQKNPGKIDRVIFCLFLEKDVEIYEQQMQLFFPAGSS